MSLSPREWCSQCISKIIVFMLSSVCSATQNSREQENERLIKNYKIRGLI